MPTKPDDTPARSGTHGASVTDLTAARHERQASAAEESGVVTAPGKPAVPATVPATATRVRKAANRRFDTEKVARLKEQIESGRYEIDPFSVADRFIEHERNSS